MKALRSHARRPTGKTQITATKPCDTATDLAVAYTPGIATPCRAIQRHPDSVYRHTAKGNLVAIVSNGTGVLRGALDVRATRIDEEMKRAACREIAAVARRSTSFGRDRIIPMPLDSEVLPRVAAAVAGAAVRTGVASRPLTDLTAYSDSVANRIRLSHEERAHCAPAAPEARHG
jgi:malic enzyme